MRKYIIPGVGVIFCGILIYQTYSLNTIKGELENIKSANMTLQEEVSSLSSELSSQIQSTLNEELGKSYLTKDVSFKLNNNTDTGYDLTVRAELSELKENSKIENEIEELVRKHYNISLNKKVEKEAKTKESK